MKRVALSVSNDLSTDQRVQRSISVLLEQGYEVEFIGRKLPSSKAFKPSYPTKRFKLIFRKGFLFYAQLNIWLFFYLLFKKPFAIYWSNDLDTLLPNYLVARLYRKPLIYDAHEYFCGVPEIQNRPIVKLVWQSLEKWLFPKLNYTLTVNDSIAELYAREYGIRPLVLRNIGSSFIPVEPRNRQDLGLPEDAFLVINQGAGINIDRGMEEFLDAMPLLSDDIHLLIVGKGDVLPVLKSKVHSSSNLSKRVHFVEPQPYAKLLEYTMAADLGISLDKDTNVNYRFSLPNKIFDYIKSGIPILCSNLIEVRRIVVENNLGLSTTHEAIDIKNKVEAIRSQGKEHYQNALLQAAKKYNWEEEKKVLIKLLSRIEKQKSL